MRLSFHEDLRGRTVIDAAARAIGEVEALFLDPETWRVDALRVRLRREVADQLGVPRGLLHGATIEVPTALVGAVGDAVSLRVPAAELRRGQLPAEPTPAPSTP